MDPLSEPEPEVSEELHLVATEPDPACLARVPPSPMPTSRSTQTIAHLVIVAILIAGLTAVHGTWSRANGVQRRLE
ncbi:MAG: hypothetical protein ABIW84_04250, partial [Ilumatobacteraceae bacterium]